MFSTKRKGWNLFDFEPVPVIFGKGQYIPAHVVRQARQCVNRRAIDGVKEDQIDSIFVVKVALHIFRSVKLSGRLFKAQVDQCAEKQYVQIESNNGS